MAERSKGYSMRGVIEQWSGLMMQGKKRVLNRPTRRQFLGQTLAMLAAPTIVPSSVFGAGAPSNRITMGCIGVGGMGTNNMRAFLNFKDVQVVAVCDPVQASNQYGHWYNHGWNGAWFGREPARKIVNAHYEQRTDRADYKGCTAYADFRELLARDDIDAVTVVTPDHWHAPISIAAAHRGIHIYCEKPLTLTIAEGRAMVEAVRRHGVVLQTGSHQRSEARRRHMCELVRNGYVGKLERIETRVGPNHRKAPKADWKPMPVPEWLDYNMWLGPAPWAPYHKARCLYNFRFLWDYSGGNLTNLGAHCIDWAQWAHGTDDTGPVEVEDLGGVFPTDGLYDVADPVHFVARYADGVELYCHTEPTPWTVRFEGTDGWIADNGQAEPASLWQELIGAKEEHLYRSDDHHRNFIDCIRTGREPVAPVEVGHRSATVCHLGNIAMKLRTKLKWDPVAERFLGNDEANQMLDRPERAYWCL